MRFKKNPETRTYESAYSSNSTSTENSIESQYIDNSLSTGSQPYSNEYDVTGNESQISVSTSSNSKTDIVILRSEGSIVDNAYIQAGGSYTFNLANGSYQVFFYGGKGWNPNKTMSSGLAGGFVANVGLIQKDSPVSLNYQSLSYTVPQQNGNFSTQQSNASEIF